MPLHHQHIVARFVRLIRILWTFYKSYMPMALLMTISCAVILWAWGISTFTILFWFKLATFGLVYYYMETVEEKVFYYYQNLGVSKILLWAATLSFDFILFLSVIIITYQLR